MIVPRDVSTPERARRAARVTPVPPRPRGRPKKTAEERAAYERAIVQATRKVFARTGYHALSVELILAEAGVARPTFYRYFASVNEPMELVLRDLYRDLVDSIAEVLDGGLARAAKLEAVLLAYRNWGARLGPVLKALFSELHDVHSPVSRHRRRTLARLSKMLLADWRAEGRPAPSALIVDALLIGVEFLGYRYHLRSRRSPADWKATRDAMLRLALGLLSGEHELAHALPIAHSLGIDLGPRTRRAPPGG